MPLAYIAWLLLLAVLLFFPASKMIWVLSVRRLERKLARQLNEEERAGQRRRARFIAAIVCLAFSALFNLRILDGV